MSRMNQAMSDLLRFNNALLPQKRSKFDKSHSVLTTMDSGYLVPIDWDMVLPGDEKEIRVSALARMATPIAPTMDFAKLYIASFYIPHRLWWSNARKFYGENLDADFNEDGEYEFPSLNPSMYRVPVDGYKPVSDEGGDWRLNDYLGFPVIDFNPASRMSSSTDIAPKVKANAGLHRCYQLVWNEYFRNSSVQPALQLSTGDTVTSSEWNVIRQLRLVNKGPDMFTTLLRRPQAGNDVTLPLGEWAPVVTRGSTEGSIGEAKTNIPLRWYNIANGGAVGFLDDVSNIYLRNRMTYASPGISNPSVEDYGIGYNIAPNNLWADLTYATAATINNLRSAITIQHLLEVDSIAGKRYQQILQAHWSVLTPDATLQRPELLGISSTPIGMRQVLQTSATGAGDTPQGTTAAFSATNIENEWLCNKAFTEPGFLIHVAWIRPEHSYSQGLDPLLNKLSRYEQYWPAFDNIGNQPVYKSAIFMANNSNTGYTSDISYLDDVFGYEEAWTSYRVRPNRVSGLMRPDVNGSLAFWNYTTALKAPPTLNSAFIQEDPELIDRTIAVSDEPQFLLDVWFDYKDTKNMGVHSTPGLTRL